MSKLIIHGGEKLKGKVRISGNKNAILPCLAASLLTEDTIILKNVPSILDVDVSLAILKALGAQIERTESIVKIQGFKMPNSISLPKDLAVKLRASILFVGPLLVRAKDVEFFHPGGDVIGKRSIDTHLLGFKELGFAFKVDDKRYKGYKTKDIDLGKEIFLEEASVTATENLVMASVLGKRKVTLKNCATEPHIVDLCNLLTRMGASIQGIGSSTLIIEGVDKLSGAEFTIGGDYMEFGTYAIAAAITQGEIEIVKDHLPDLDPIIVPLRNMGIVFEDKGEVIKIYAKHIIPIPRLHVNIWPGFPTDLMSVAIVLATQANGVSLMHDWMYESRMFFVDKLIAMGAGIVIADPHRVLVCGKSKLYGRILETPDIRAGMALILAALIADGESVINRSELIERGYENIVEKLSGLGADITKIE